MNFERGGVSRIPGTTPFANGKAVGRIPDPFDNTVANSIFGKNRGTARTTAVTGRRQKIVRFKSARLRRSSRPNISQVEQPAGT
jgi:hypothetical protein